VLLVGLGKKAAIDAEGLRRAAALAVKRAESAGTKEASLWVHAALADLAGGPRVVGQAVAEGAAMGGYRYETCKSDAKPAKLASVHVVGEGRELSAGFAHGRITSAANLFARDLQNAPANRMTPRILAAAAKKLATKSDRIRCNVLDERAMKRFGMGLLLGVSQGSVEPPRLIHLSYRPKRAARGRIALVGKGLTFDSGGYSLKPALKMEDMRFDMSGGAAVLGVFHALAELDLPLEVHGVVPSSENLIDGGATKPGDVHTAMNGKTVEVLNTDAEGRLILGDALAYCEKEIEPDTIIDLATLTGAVVTALGHELSGLFASNERLREALQTAGEAVGERLWPLPLMDYHKTFVKGQNADLRNVTTPDVGAGSTAGAAFLSYFVGDGTAWAHLDIAGTAYGGCSATGSAARAVPELEHVS
jgi:leucyl aminopeptidase